MGDDYMVRKKKVKRKKSVEKKKDTKKEKAEKKKVEEKAEKKVERKAEKEKVDKRKKNVKKKKNSKEKVERVGKVDEVRKVENNSKKKDSKEIVSWSSALSVGEKTIDSQHKKLIGQIEELEKNLKEDNSLPGVRKCIHFLDSYVKEHFTYEEAYMKKNKYSGLEEHKRIHNEFIKFYEEFKKELTLKLTKVVDAKSFAKEHVKKVHEFLGNWIIEHIKGEDKKYCEEINPKKCGKLDKEVIKNKDVAEKPIKEKKKGKIDVSEIAKEIKEEQIKEQREPVSDLANEGKDKKIKKGSGRYVVTGVPGFDDLLEQGIPKGNALLIACGAGSGKTIFSLQSLVHQAKKGKKCLYMSFEERESRLISHMEDFGWNPKELIEKGNLKIMRINPFDITRNVDALLAKQKGELLIEIDPVIIPKDFKPDFIALDSLTAIASAFTGKEENYRIYIEQLFRFFEKIGATSFLITETEQIPKIFSKTGVEEFLADGVIVFYNLKHGNVRENAIEILKLRGAAHQKKIVAMQITGKGIMVYPEQEVFSEISESG
ncbi:bacteriohemerythrin [archaeon]|jgi:hemerythrin-like metal-binding protein|nr:bacteriohemerythrin [archaeon]MBT4242007.1 bacteriohemerythrin [archaeon]MBT4418554.1 bacteriohemerythrin [archaeon]